MTSAHPVTTPHPSCYVIHEVGVTTTGAPTTVLSEHGLIFARDGWLKMEQRYEALSLPGSVTVVPAGVPHRPLAGENLDFWLLGFTAGGFGFDEEQAIMRPFAEVRQGAAPVIPLQPKAQKLLIGWFELLASETEMQTPESADIQRSLITLILGQVARASPASGDRATGSALVAMALRFIQRNALTSISLADVAEAVGRSAPHVASVVKTETGFTMGTWITSARVAKAAQLLQHTDLAIDQIAPYIGWQDTTHFIRQFRKVYGMTPAAWRKKQRLSA